MSVFSGWHGFIAAWLVTGIVIQIVRAVRSKGLPSNNEILFGNVIFGAILYFGGFWG